MCTIARYLKSSHLNMNHSNNSHNKEEKKKSAFPLKHQRFKFSASTELCIELYKKEIISSWKKTQLCVLVWEKWSLSLSRACWKRKAVLRQCKEFKAHTLNKPPLCCYTLASCCEQHWCECVFNSLTLFPPPRRDFTRYKWQRRLCINLSTQTQAGICVC